MSEFGDIAIACLKLRAALPAELQETFATVEIAALRHAVGLEAQRLRQVEDRPLAPVLELHQEFHRHSRKVGA